MKTYAIRLTNGMDLKKELFDFTQKHQIKSGFIMTCVGHLTRATLRMADPSIIKNFEEHFEIVSLVGTLCMDDVHLHICLSDKNGNCIGGHLKNNCIVGVTAEIIIGELDNYEFSRDFDSNTGYKELIIKNI